MRNHGQVLTPGRYVGAKAQEDEGEPFDEEMKRVVVQLREQQAEATKLDAAIAANLEELGYASQEVAEGDAFAAWCGCPYLPRTCARGRGRGARSPPPRSGLPVDSAQAPGEVMQAQRRI